MGNCALSRLALCLVAVSVWGCGRSDREAPKVPLDQVNTTRTGTSEVGTPALMTGEAKTALDSGNVLFRARAYDRALEQYRLSAQLAPTELSPLLGILMIADATKNTTLGDSAMQRVRQLNPAAADSAAARPHAEITKAHPRAK